jgi:3-methyladenine DNA glycosylase/8-oxoguanine DNA glycosylase
VTHDLRLAARGPVDLARMAAFLTSWPAATHGGLDDDGHLRLALVADDLEHAAGVALRQEGPAALLATFPSEPSPALVTQVRRVLSLDLDGERLAEVARSDPLLGALVTRAPGLRPVLFGSPYEGAAWTVLSARTPAATAAVHRRRLQDEYGEPVDVLGRTLHTFPLPQRLLGVESLPGVPAEKVRRLHGVAEAALDSRLRAEHLAAMPYEEVVRTLKTVRGIGDFYAQLILVRALQGTDVFPVGEPRVRAALEQLAGRPLTEGDVGRLTARWSPFRGWAAFLLRGT